MSRQFTTWRVCQVCGLATPADHVEGWLVSPHRTRREITVVRCPQHWSEWALRNCRDGRTKVMRQKAREAAQMPAPPIPAHLSPFPTQERKEA